MANKTRLEKLMNHLEDLSFDEVIELYVEAKTGKMYIEALNDIPLTLHDKLFEAGAELDIYLKEKV